MQHVLSSVFPVTLSTYMYETYFRVMNAVFITKDTSENYKKLTSELYFLRRAMFIQGAISIPDSGVGIK